MGQEGREQGRGGVVGEEVGEVGLGARTGFSVTDTRETISLFVSD